MSVRVISLHLLRVDDTGVPVIVSSARAPPREEGTSWSTVTEGFTDEQVTEVVRRRVRLHFNNTGRIEFESAMAVFRVSLLDTMTLCIVAITDSALPFPTALDFINLVQDSVLVDSSWMTSLEKGEQLQDAMEPTFAQFIMTENGKNHAHSEKISNMQRQVDDVKTVMQNNVQMIMERGERLENIEARSENLATSSENFKMTARRVQRKFCMLNAKWTVITGIGITLLVIVLILIILSATGVIGKKD